MATRDIIVIGGSAGSIEAATALFAGLPRELEAAVFLVIHLPPDARSALPEIISRAGALRAVSATDGEPIRRGRVYVAPPGRHLLLDDGVVRLSYGPKENRHRPALDPLFRSAARQYGARVIGVILSGNQYDGAAGLLRIREAGGVVLVQDPESAMYAGMPRSAIERVAPDAVLEPADLAAALVRMVGDPAPSTPEGSEAMSSSAHSPVPDAVAAEDRQRRPGVPSTQACPECHGVLWETEEGGLLQFRCRVGHGYSAEALLAHQSEALEVALWSALRALEEQQALARRLSARSAAQGHTRVAASYAEQAVDAAHHAALVRLALRVPPSEDQLPDGDPAAEQERVG